MGAICCLEKAWLPLQQGSSQNDGRRGQTFSKVLKREEVGQIKILEVQEWSFYWWRFKCALELNASLYKNLYSTALQKSKRRLLSQKLGCSETTRRLLSQKLGCSKTTKADLRNRRGACFLKSWAAQRPRGPISEIEEAPTFPALSAPVSFAEIMGIMSKISGETSKHAQPFLTFEKTLTTRLLAPKSKRHRPPNLESQTPNMITFSKIEERPLSESQELDP
ncbi:hypothetical protein ACFX13_047717 [Malus domestica]